MSHSLQSLFPEANEELVTSMQQGTMTATTVMTFIRQVEKKVPVEIRVNERLNKLYTQLLVLSNGPDNRFKTREEWDTIRKLSRRGRRLAKTFRMSDYEKFFGTICATAICYLSC